MDLNIKIGDKVGYLTVIGQNPNNKTRFKCRCICGKEIELLQSQLHIRRSCGCMRYAATKDLCKYRTTNDFRKQAFTVVNTTKTRANNSSGATGVYFQQSSKKWIAYITFKGKRKHLGVYSELSEAKQAREKAVKSIQSSLQKKIS